MNNSVLDRIKDTLESLAQGDVKMDGVWYGACRETKLDHWNYFVFNRRRRSKATSTSRSDNQTYYEVHVVHEDYIPEGYIDTVIHALEAQSDPHTKLKQTNDDIHFNYTFKGNTSMVVEIATITFTHPEKRC